MSLLNGLAVVPNLSQLLHVDLCLLSSFSPPVGAGSPRSGPDSVCVLGCTMSTYDTGVIQAGKTDGDGFLKRGGRTSFSRVKHENDKFLIRVYLWPLILMRALLQD